MLTNWRYCLLSWLIVIVVGAWVELTDDAGLDWEGYICAMILFPLVFPIMAITIGCFKACILVPYLVLRFCFDPDCIRRWWLTYSGWGLIIRLCEMRDLSLFFIPDKQEFEETRKAKENYEKHRKHINEVLREHGYEEDTDDD